jgi:putative tryptophan/tyrosine transport system substrate-binding protein
MAINIARRKFITVLGSIAFAWPLAARGQQPNGVRRIGMLMNVAADDLEGQTRLALFVQGLQEAGWADGRTVKIDTRWAAGDAGQFPKYAAELIALEPDVILATTTPAVMASQQASRTVPIVFVGVIDPVGSGLIASMSRPGGNATGFVLFEYALAAKWLQLLKEVAPGVTRAAVLREQNSTTGIGQFAAIQTVAPIGLELSTVDLRDAGEIERAIAAFSKVPNGGLIVTASPFGANHPDLIAALAARYKLPAVYPFRYFVSAGGLISYGPDLANEYRTASGYVDRILKGEKAANLPVQAPTKYELAINLKTAKALDLTVPPSLLALADEVIE